MYRDNDIYKFLLKLMVCVKSKFRKAILKSVYSTNYIGDGLFQMCGSKTDYCQYNLVQINIFLI